MNKIVSEFGKLKGNDFIKGLITAVLTAILAGAYKMFEAGILIPDKATLMSMVQVGLLAGVGYLMKNLGTNSKDQFLVKEEPKAPVL